MDGKIDLKQPKSNTQFWGQKKSQTSSKPKNKGLAKGMGVTGVVLLVIGSILALGLYIFLISPGLSVMNHINVLKKDGGAIGESLKNRDLVALEEDLQKTEKDLDNLRKDRDDKFGWARNLKLFKVNEFYSDSERFINAGHLGIEALRETARIVTPFSDAAGLRVSPDQQIVQQEGLMEAFQSWVSLMPQVADDMDGVIAVLAQIGDELEPINTAKYPKSFRGFAIRDNVDFAKRSLSQLEEAAPDIKKALTLAPELLGVGSPVAKRYMVIFQNDKELRPTGGFWTFYSTFRIQDALLQSDFTSKDFYSIDFTLDLIDATYDFPDAPAQYAKYLKVERWYARDTNSSPDLPTSIDQFMYYYNLANKIDPTEIKPVDGIVTIDTKVIEQLMKVTGPVTVNGITFDSNNVVLELERIASLSLREQVNRKGILGDLMEAMLVNVFNSDPSIWSKLIDTGVEMGVQKHIQGYSFNPEAQSLLEKYNFAGRIKEPVDGDYLSVVSTNLGGDKTNWFVKKQVDQSIAKEGDKWVKTVKLTYTYDQPAVDYAPFATRFRDWVRVYTPMKTELIGVEGSEDGTGAGEERGKKYYHAYIELGPGEKKEMTFKYYLPNELMTGEKYNLLIQKQGGVNGEIHTVTVNGKKQELILEKDTNLSFDL